MSTFLREIKSALLKLNNIHGIHKGRDKLLAIFQWIRNGFEIKFIYRLLCEGRLNESCYMVNAQNAFWYITCHSSLILCNSLAVSGRKTQVPNFPRVGYWCLHIQNQPFGFDWITCWHNWSSQTGPTEPHHIKRCKKKAYGFTSNTLTSHRSVALSEIIHTPSAPTDNLYSIFCLIINTKQ